jgi:hypothetical protein
MSHHTSSLAHTSFFDDDVIDALLAPNTTDLPIAVL